MAGSEDQDITIGINCSDEDDRLSLVDEEGWLFSFSLNVGYFGLCKLNYSY